ncbi:FGGY-family carbohydrate kinase [Ornithinimicrobium flavum]|uniref:aldose epimerase family protein n=1 Tax=Ornithinimicrobium flavum TaxID=1288636 RepID=UPI0010702694|nr:FGGY-family carbohydrate kinase [Ornithinimicrobium flavum]
MAEHLTTSSPSVHGTVVDLRAGDYEATVGQVGATLLSLTHRGHRLVDPVPRTELDDAWRGRTLVPWPNRVVDGRYEVGGTTYQLPVNEPETGAALHGLAAFQRWQLTGSTPSSVTWELDLPESYGYPFQVRCTSTYELDADRGLSATVSGTSTGPAPAPFGASLHPYLTCDGRPLDECRVTLPASSSAATAWRRGTSHSLWISRPAEGTCSRRKWGRRVHQDPGTPPCSVAGAGSTPGMGCLGPSAGRAPSTSTRSGPTGWSVRRLTQTWSRTSGLDQVVGAARSLSLRQALADVLGAPVLVPEPDEYVAGGAARQAAWVLASTPEPPSWPLPGLTTVAPGADGPQVRERYAEARGHVLGRVG